MASTVQENTCTKVETAADLDGKLKTLLQLMVSRIPADKKISATVVLQLLRTKYADTYSEEYIAAQTEFIANTLEELLNNRPSAHLSSLPANTTVSVEKHNGKCNANSNANHDEKSDITNSHGNTTNESESSSSYSGDDDDEEEEEEESDYDNDEEDDEEDGEDESFYSSSSDSDNDDEEKEEDDDNTSVEHQNKRVKVEGEENVQQSSDKTAQNDKNNNDVESKSVHQRCNGMLTCLKKLSYRVRSREDNESEQEYIDNVLMVEFVKHGLDPMRFSKSDIHRYKMKREVELLQQDGASLALDRRQRLGRGYSNVELRNGENGKEANSAAHDTVNPSQSTYATSKFLDDADDEEHEEQEE